MGAMLSHHSDASRHDSPHATLTDSRHVKEKMTMELVLKDIPVAERYKFLTALVIPRPVALVTSRNENGLHNAAPFSFFNLFSDEPAIVVLGISARPDNRTKDTLKNIKPNSSSSSTWSITGSSTRCTYAPRMCHPTKARSNTRGSRCRRAGWSMGNASPNSPRRSK